MAKGYSGMRSKGSSKAPTFNQKGTKPRGPGGMASGMRGGPKSGAKQKGFSK